jgi:hypothetical protein
MVDMPVGYDVRKAAQVIAFLILEQGGSADMIKTVKLAYMSDRRFLELYDRPILNDDFNNLPYGPIDSATLDYIKGAGSEAEKAIWGEYVTAVDDSHKFKTATNNIYFGELSEAEEAVLKETVGKFKDYEPFGSVNWIHDNCSEWTDPRGSALPLSYEEVFDALGKDHVKEKVAHIDDMRRLVGAAKS